MPPKKQNIAKALSRRERTGSNVRRVVQAMVSERVQPAVIRFEDQIRTEEQRLATRQQLMTQNYVQVGNQRRRITVEQKADMVRANALAREKIGRLKYRKTEASKYFWKLEKGGGPPPPPPPGSVGFA